MPIKLNPIGVVHSPFKRKEDIRPERYACADGFAAVEGELEILREYEAGLNDTEGFSHLIVLFAFHESHGYKLHVRPPHEKKIRGVFSTRSPHRPNSVGMTVVELVGRRRNILKVKELDMIEGTPILDIKPYTPRDQKVPARFGWLEKRKN